ncbi:phosphonate C-P lyase system protein PhnG [Brevibacillus nitrificans]|uniref:phosphonate C-P lyase system protein PhnG n=1 Tax=Brevibacillus nitrificans TaxID=651560 RepID=UPI00285D2E39|nr:phosphonate C-P lyase system protein PhnG [Brevibacillus nitrificans]MDR7317128.1 alpha-D-ribose 1-methylphosphonate 5-triphosphate synthase subunit PhnG [Brevibacillus nitrificans]
MKRKRRTEILINGARELAGSGELAAQLAEEILERYDVKTIEEPNQGLVMVKVRETAQKSLFYLGEVLVTECKVQINGSIGLGVLHSHDRKLAYHLAVIDAAYEAGLKETADWTDRLIQEEAAYQKQRLAVQSGVLKTKVSFETMDEE